MIIGCEITKSAVVIDPGDNAVRILLALERHGLSTRHIIHTHAHLDHLGATKEVHDSVGGDTGLHEDDLFLCDHLAEQAQLFGLPTPQTPKIDHFLKNGDRLSFGECTVEVLHTPGHTPGSLCFYVEGVGMITGDTLFSGSVGRTDLWKGSHPTLIASIKKQLLSFPDETTVYPGHGPQTSIGNERLKNPFLS